MAHIPSEEEIQQRLAMQERIKERLKNINLEGRVSKLVRVEPPPKPQVEKLSEKEIKRRVDEFMKPLAKKMWAPQIQKKTSTDPTCSKYFGNPWLYANEDWPMIAGKPATFVMQLNISTLPEEMAEKLGKKGLLQFFYQTSNSVYCSSFDELALVRIVDTTKPGKTLTQPDIEDYSIPEEKIIINWKEYLEYPHNEDLDDINGYNALEELAEGNGVYLNDLGGENYQGDKLGGWPFWTQAGSSLDGYVYQIDAGCFFNGLKVPAHAPGLFAGDGTGHIYVDPENGRGDFFWDCT